MRVFESRLLVHLWFWNQKLKTVDGCDLIFLLFLINVFSFHFLYSMFTWFRVDLPAQSNTSSTETLTRFTFNGMLLWMSYETSSFFLNTYTVDEPLILIPENTWWKPWPLLPSVCSLLRSHRNNGSFGQKTHNSRGPFLLFDGFAINNF